MRISKTLAPLHPSQIPIISTNNKPSPAAALRITPSMDISMLGSMSPSRRCSKDHTTPSRAIHSIARLKAMHRQASAARLRAMHKQVSAAS